MLLLSARFYALFLPVLYLYIVFFVLQDNKWLYGSFCHSLWSYGPVGGCGCHKSCHVLRRSEGIAGADWCSVAIAVLPKTFVSEVAVFLLRCCMDGAVPTSRVRRYVTMLSCGALWRFCLFDFHLVIANWSLWLSLNALGKTSCPELSCVAKGSR